MASFPPVLDLDIPMIEATVWGSEYSPERKKVLVLETKHSNHQILVFLKNDVRIEFPTYCALYLAKRLVLAYRDYMENLDYLLIFAQECRDIVEDYSDFCSHSGVYANIPNKIYPLYRPKNIARSTDSMRAHQIAT